MMEWQVLEQAQINDDIVVNETVRDWDLWNMNIDARLWQKGETAKMHKMHDLNAGKYMESNLDKKWSML